MEKLLCTYFFLLSSFLVFSQEKYSNWDSDYLSTEKPYEIQLSKNKKGVVTFWIDAAPSGSYTKRAGFKIDSGEDLDNFRTFLMDCKGKYLEWVQVAKSNNVDKLTKVMDFKVKRLGAFWLDYKDWEFDYSVSPSASFHILDYDGVLYHLLIVRTGELTASSNSYKKDDGAMLVFSSEKEIDDFLSKIDLSKAEKSLNSAKKEDLFK